MKKLFLLITVFLLASFAPPLNNPQYIFDGNSQSVWWDYYLPVKLNSQMRSSGHVFAGQFYGVSGKNTLQLIADFPTKIAPIIRKGDRVYLWEIINDLRANGGATAQECYDHLVTYAGLVHAKGAKIYIINYIATDYAGDSPTVYSRGMGCNTIIAADPSPFDGVIDVGSMSIFNEVSDCANATYYYDKLHLTTRGMDSIAYKAWRDTR